MLERHNSQQIRKDDLDCWLTSKEPLLLLLILVVFILGSLAVAHAGLLYALALSS
ncbi:hypothetical protein QEZ52_00460 [Aliisedimentitalea scapharcae]|uniref:Uncharacterized protein n=1 Tax=Aliisedimentitalea scapharcae TaxID=1524259 RepID=A0ABZ2XSI3_9RHOB